MYTSMVPPQFVILIVCIFLLEGDIHVQFIVCDYAYIIKRNMSINQIDF